MPSGMKMMIRITASAVDREIEARARFSGSAAIPESGSAAPVPIAEPIGEATPPSSAIVSNTIELAKANWSGLT